MAAVRDGNNVRLFVGGKSRIDFTIPGDALVVADESSLPQLGRAFPGVIHAPRISSDPRYRTEFEPPSALASDGNTTALYHFDEGAGDVLTDSSGHGHHGKIAGARWVPGIAGGPPADPKPRNSNAQSPPPVNAP